MPTRTVPQQQEEHLSINTIRKLYGWDEELRGVIRGGCVWESSTTWWAYADCFCVGSIRNRQIGINLFLLFQNHIKATGDNKAYVYLVLGSLTKGIPVPSHSHFCQLLPRHLLGYGATTVDVDHYRNILKNELQPARRTCNNGGYCSWTFRYHANRQAKSFAEQLMADRALQQLNPRGAWQSSRCPCHCSWEWFLPQKGLL